MAPAIIQAALPLECSRFTVLLAQVAVENRLPKICIDLKAI
jgi:hypothetical protein